MVKRRNGANERARVCVVYRRLDIETGIGRNPRKTIHFPRAISRLDSLPSYVWIPFRVSNRSLHRRARTHARVCAPVCTRYVPWVTPPALHVPAPDRTRVSPPSARSLWDASPGHESPHPPATRDAPGARRIYMCLRLALANFGGRPARNVNNEALGGYRAMGVRCQRNGKDGPTHNFGKKTQRAKKESYGRR